MTAIRNAEQFGEEISIVFKKYKEEKEAFDEGIFVSGSVGDDEDDYDDDYNDDFTREPRTEFEKSSSKMDGVLRQAEHDTQFLSHDLVSVLIKRISLLPASLYVVISLVPRARMTLYQIFGKI